MQAPCEGALGATERGVQSHHNNGAAEAAIEPSEIKYNLLNLIENSVAAPAAPLLV